MRKVPCTGLFELILCRRKSTVTTHASFSIFRVGVVAGILLLSGVVPVFTAYQLNDTGRSNPGYGSIWAPGDEEWNTTFGGSNIDVGYCAQQTTDGGFILTGYTRSYGASGHNIWLVKTDSFGDEQWNTTFGGNSDDEAESVQQTSDGGYIVAGWTKSAGAGLKDVWLIKTDSMGTMVWNKLFGGANDDGATWVQQTSDGGYIVSGYTSSFGTGSVDVWLIKTDDLGNQQWVKTLGGYSSDGAWCVQQTTDGGYVLTGWTYSYGPGAIGNAWLVKTDSGGTMEWNKAFGGTDVDRGYHVQQTSDGGYILTGYTASYGAGLDDVWLIKTDDVGTQEWAKTFGGGGRDYGNCVQQTLDGGYIITGYTLSFGAGGDDVWVIKTDSSGNLVWDTTCGGPYSDVGYCVQQTSDGGYIVTGHTLSFGAGVHDMWLIKLEGSGVPPLVVDANGPYEGFVNESIAFSGTVSGGVPPYSFVWDFGDGASAYVQNPEHVYSAGGVYEAVFSVVDHVGSEANDSTVVTVLVRDTLPPEVSIIQPVEKSLYLMNRRLFSFFVTVVVGSLEVKVNASDSGSGVASVVFSLNGVEKNTSVVPPYVWMWDERMFGRCVLEVKAFDAVGNDATVSITVFRLF